MVVNWVAWKVALKAEKMVDLMVDSTVENLVD